MNKKDFLNEVTLYVNNRGWYQFSGLNEDSYNQAWEKANEIIPGLKETISLLSYEEFVHNNFESQYRFSDQFYYISITGSWNPELDKLKKNEQQD